MALNNGNNNEEISSNAIKSPLLNSLRDTLNLYINDNERKELFVRQRKIDLMKKNHEEVVAVVNELNTSECPYVKKTLLPLLQESLQQKTIDSLLVITQNLYASHLGKDSFSAKKQAIKREFHILYKKKMLDNRLIFGLGMTLHQKPTSQYDAGTFWNDIKKRMYTGNDIYGSFWNTVTAPEKAAVVEKKHNDIASTLTSKE